MGWDMKNIGFFILLVCSLMFILSLNIISQTKNDGWEEGSKLNKLFSTQKVDTLTGVIIQSSEVSPIRGMAKGILLLLKTDKDTVSVLLCPTWFTDLLNIKFKPKDEAVVEGCNAVCSGNHVFIASKLTANGIILQVRDDKGNPIWDRMR